MQELSLTKFTPPQQLRTVFENVETCSEQWNPLVPYLETSDKNIQVSSSLFEFNKASVKQNTDAQTVEDENDLVLNETAKTDAEKQLAESTPVKDTNRTICGKHTLDEQQNDNFISQESFDSIELAEECRDEFVNFAPQTQNCRKKNKRTSAISMASSIAALVPLIWGSKDDELSEISDQSFLPYEHEEFLQQGNISESNQFTANPKKNRASLISNRYSTQKIKDMLTFSTNGFKRNANMGVAAQTVADWRSTLESSFDTCLGNLSRFELEVPTVNSATDRYYSTTGSTSNRNKSRLRTWRRKSRIFFNNFGSASNTSQISRNIYKPTHAQSYEDEIINAPSLDTDTTMDISEFSECSIKTRQSSQRNVGQIQEPKVKQNKRSKLRAFLQSLTVK